MLSYFYFLCSSFFFFPFFFSLSFSFSLSLELSTGLVIAVILGVVSFVLVILCIVCFVRRRQIQAVTYKRFTENSAQPSVIPDSHFPSIAEHALRQEDPVRTNELLWEKQHIQKDIKNNIFKFGRLYLFIYLSIYSLSSSFWHFLSTFYLILSLFLSFFVSFYFFSRSFFLSFFFLSTF